jgi:acylphosphatase
MTTLYFLPVVLVLVSLAYPARADDPQKEPPAKPIARMVHYAGDVQGVGFRATVVDIARGHPVTGWVKNLSDGRVQLLVEGQEEAVTKFLDAVRTRWKRNIEKELSEEKTPSGKYQGFTIMR